MYVFCNIEVKALELFFICGVFWGFFWGGGVGFFMPSNWSDLVWYQSML